MQDNSSANLKNKAKELFRQLESQYLDRLDYIETQENLINKQNTLINDKLGLIGEQKGILEDTTDKISTQKRKLIYDQKDSNYYSTIIAIMKTILLIITIALIVILSKSK